MILFCFGRQVPSCQPAQDHFAVAFLVQGDLSGARQDPLVLRSPATMVPFLAPRYANMCLDANPVCFFVSHYLLGCSPFNVFFLSVLVCTSTHQSVAGTLPIFPGV